MAFLDKALDLLDNVENEVGGDLEFVRDDNLSDSEKGNIYQNENVYNRLLPYDVATESQQHLMRIKAHMAKSIQLDQEATYELFIDLERYIDLYGLAFSKTDHIKLVKLHYELLVSETSMDLYYIPYVARSYTRLMKKRFLISKEELQLDWRPLCATYERLLFNQTEALGLRFVPEILESNLSQAIRLSRAHFPLEATQEMLDEWRPLLSPFSVSIQRAITHMSLFLPTSLEPMHHDKGFKLWFDEVIELWLNNKVSPASEAKLTRLLARLASDCLGYVDWNPYIHRIFNHVKTHLNLGSRQQLRRSSEISDVQPYVLWIIYMISPDNSCMDHISKLFKAMESFYHPSNTDRRWHSKLQQFLYKLPAFYVTRLYRERYKKNIWSRLVPESHRLTDEQTTRFVESLLPVVLTSMFSQVGCSSASLAFRDLAILRPEKVVPPLLDRLYGSYETLTEPLRLLASINCMTAVIPAMVRPCKFFPQGPSHVVPLMVNLLPGIDSNDIRKCIAVFRFIATLAAHIRIEDFSYLVEERPDLTFEQQQLCLSTCQFEDFVLQFLDKCFILIENTATISFANLDQEARLKNGEEGIIEAAISSVTLSILAQSSPQIQRAALDKVYHHITSHIFDTKTQGKAIATLCLACAKANPENTLAKFLPYFGRLILTLTDNDEVFKESILDDELLFSLLLLSEIVRCHSSHLLDYKELIISVLQRSLKLKSKEAYMLACSILRHLLRALTSITCNDWRNIDLDSMTTENPNFLPFDVWGHTTKISELNLKWEIPGPDARSFARELLETFLRQSVHDLLEWSEGSLKLSREEVQRDLHVVLSSLVGAASVLPTLVSPAIDLCPFEVPLIPMYINNTGTEPLSFEDGTNIRTWIVESMKKVLQHIKVASEDDTKSSSLICEIFSMTISYFGYQKHELRLAAQRIKSMKNSFHNKLLGPKRYLRYLLVESVAQQHRAMLLNKGQPNFTQLHMDVLKEMFELSQSHYVEVRVIAQETVYLMLNYFPFSENILVPMLVKELQQRDIEHRKFKGLLYLLLARRSYSSIMVDPSWERLCQLWPAVVESPHSEKPSIVKLLDRICKVVQKGFDTFQLAHGFPENVKKVANELWKDDSIDLKQYQPPSEETIQLVKLGVQERNKQHIDCYEQLVDKLVDLIENPTLHWHRRLVAFNLFTHLMRDDHPLNVKALKMCLNCLINERLAIRVASVLLVTGQLKLHKRKHVTRNINFSNQSDKTCYDDNMSVIEEETMNISIEDKLPSSSDSGSKKDSYFTLSNSNKWMQYKLNKEVYPKEYWNRMIFIDKPHIGFYQWPTVYKAYEPYEKQPKLDRDISELNIHEQVVFETMSDSAFVERLVHFFCFEEQKGVVENRRFDNKRAFFWKALFRNFGLSILTPFKSYILEYSVDKCEYKRKFVIELLSGLMRGSKHWSYEMMVELREFMLSTLERMTICQENLNDWIGFINCTFRHRDIRRFEWLLEYLITKSTDPIHAGASTVSPFIQATRLSLAHYSMMQCEWRATDHVFPTVLKNLQPQDHLLAYADVRTCLASIYSLVFMFDDQTVKYKIAGTLDASPKRIDFINFLLPKLAMLERLSNVSIMSAESEQDTGTVAKIAQLILKTVHTEDEPEKMDIVTSDLESKVTTELIDGIKTDEDLTIQSKHLSKISTLISNIGSTDIVPNLTASASSSSVSSAAGASTDQATDDAEEAKERKKAMKVMKLTSCWIIYLLCRMRCPLAADYFKLLPIICEMGREGNDPELSTDSIAAIAILANSTLSSEAVVESLACIRKIIAHHSWHARVTAATFLEIMVSSNMFNLLNNKAWIGDIEDIVINHLILDERIEVRESAAVTLSGMMHCEFIKITPKLIDEFKRRASEPLVRKKMASGTTIVDSKCVVIRHSGIAGLCASVEAYPYTVPDFLPEILTLLSDHLTDPQPISTTIKKTMSNFRRTHHDNWQSDKEKFTDDQLCVLADLLVSPSYYA